MIKKVDLLFTNEVTLEDDRIMKLEYNITEHQNEENEEPYYGLQIKKYLDGETEVGEIEGISFSRDKVEAIARILFRNTVTPISMAEIVDDLITLETV